MIELKNVSKVFPTAEGEFHALKDVSLTIGNGDIYGIVGMSGAGTVSYKHLPLRPNPGG